MNVDPNRVDKAHTRPARPPAGPRTEPGEPPRGTASAPDTGGPLMLSQRAETFLKVRPQLEALALPSREARIAEVSALIASGAYEVRGEDIAGAMLRDPAIPSVLGLTRSR